MTEVTINVAGDSEYPEYLRMLVVGQPGVGKTTLASNFPNPLWINAGCGITTLARMGDIPYVNVNNEMDLFAVKQLLDRGPQEREYVLGRPVDTLVVDTVDELQRILMAERLNTERRSETKMEDWGWLNARFHAIFGGLTQLPLNVVFIAHTKDVSVGEDRSSSLGLRVSLLSISMSMLICLCGCVRLRSRCQNLKRSVSLELSSWV